METKSIFNVKCRSCEELHFLSRFYLFLSCVWLDLHLQQIISLSVVFLLHN